MEESAPLEESEEQMRATGGGAQSARMPAMEESAQSREVACRQPKREVAVLGGVRR
jgi:hypothetical protein